MHGGTTKKIIGRCGQEIGIIIFGEGEKGQEEIKFSGGGIGQGARKKFLEWGIGQGGKKFWREGGGGEKYKKGILSLISGCSKLLWGSIPSSP